MPEAGEPRAEKPPQGRRRRPWLRTVTIAAAVLTTLAVVALIGRRTFLRNEFDLNTLIDDSAGIAPSSPVLLNGIDVGHVVSVTLSGSADPDKTVRILMRFPRRFLRDIPEDSTAAITSSNLLGDKYINISRGSHAQHIQPGAALTATTTQDIGTFLSSANGPLNQINGIFAHVDTILGYIDNQEGTLGKLINGKSLANHMTAISGDQKQIVTDFGQGRGTLMRFNEIQTEIQKPLARFHAIAADMDRGRGSLGMFLHDPNTPTVNAGMQAIMREANEAVAAFNAGDRTSDLLDRMRNVSTRLDEITEKIDSGQGTLGQLTVNPQLRDSLTRVREEMDRLTAEISKKPTKFIHFSFGLF